MLLALLPAELIIKEWQQNTVLSPEKISQEINLKLVAQIAPNYFYTSWSFIFDPSQKINLQEVKVNNLPGKYIFQDNNLKVNFDKLANNQAINITIKYQENDSRNSTYFTQQYSSIPSWAKEAKGQISVLLAENYVICDYPKIFQKNNNYLVWTGIVPETGIEGLFRYTKQQARWQIKKTISISGSGTAQGFEISLPNYFSTGQNKTLAQEIKTSIEPLAHSISANYSNYKFKTLNTIAMEINGSVASGLEFYNFNLPDKNNFLSLSPKNLSIAEQLANNILRQRSVLPDYIRLAKWVHEYINYDYGYSGRTMTIQQIIASRKGVCEHYTQLYLSLCRARGIPALEINGYAYSTGALSGQPEGWGPHSWTVVNINDKWLPVDPTWDLTDGIMPVSHIGFYYKEFNPYSYMLKNYYGRLFVDENKITIEEIQ